MNSQIFSNKRKLAIIALVLANVIWGAAGPIFKWSLTNIPPFTLAFLRFSLGAIILLPFIYKEIFKINRTDIPKLILFGLCGVTFNISFFFLGLRLAPSVNSSLIATTQPLILLVIGVLFLKEQVEPHEILGTLISFFGVLLIILLPFLIYGFQGEAISLGNFLFVLAALGAVGGTFFGKQVFEKNPPLPATFWSFVLGSLTFLPFFVFEHLANPYWATQLTTPGFVGIIYGVVFSSALAYSLSDWAISQIEASETGIFTYLMPVTAIAVAIPFFGEKITWQIAIGAILIITGITLAQTHLHKRREV